MNALTRSLLRGTLTMAIAAAATIALFPDAMADDRAKQDYAEAKAMYKSAHEALNAERYEDAAKTFARVYEKFADSEYGGNALYWRAFALYRMGGTSRMKEAKEALELQMNRYSEANTRDDVSALYYRILGKLAAEGDAEAAERLARDTGERFGDGEDETPADLEEKMMAMDALLNMKPERALLILKKVLNDDRPEYAELREKALFVISQHHTEESAAILLKLAREDPDAKVRKRAVFWLSQVEADAVLDLLEELLFDARDPELQEQAIFSIAQHHDERSAELLRRVALDEKMSRKVRMNAIFWLGQGGGGEDQVEFLIGLYSQLGDDPEIKEKVLFAVSETAGTRGARWLLEIASDPSETTEMRKRALFWASQHSSVDLDALVEVYKKGSSMELREHAIFALSQRPEKRAVDVMIGLARTEKNSELKRKLIFWIGQSQDPRAEEFLMEIISE